jgi:hypothetical protein
MRRGASGQAGANGRPGDQPGRQLGHRSQPERCADYRAEYQAERHLAAASSSHLHPPILAADQRRRIARTGGLAVPRKRDILDGKDGTAA